MKQTRILMGMPITVQINDASASEADLAAVFDYFESVDRRFSTYKNDSEISRLNRGEFALEDSSREMKTVFALAEQTRLETNGFFDILHDGLYDPSGIVKGWAIQNAAGILERKGYRDFFVDAGGDVQVHGKNEQGEEWRVGIRSPFNMDEIVKVLHVTDCGVATSGTYVRGQHIYNPKQEDREITEVLSLTVIGPSVYQADRFATAAFAMGREGIQFVEALDGFEGYLIDREKQATYTSGFYRYVLS